MTPEELDAIRDWVAAGPTEPVVPRLLAEVDRLTADHEWTLGVCDWLTEQYIAAQTRVAELETEQAALDAALDEVDRADPERGVAWGIDSENCRAWERAVARHRGRQS